jgi:hypothetical protein
MRFSKLLIVFTLLLMMIPAISASADFNGSWTASLSAGNIRIGSNFTDWTASPTTMDITLYQVTSSGDVYVSSNSVYIGAYQSIGGWYNLATNQPAGTYKVVLDSTTGETSGVSLVNY